MNRLVDQVRQGGLWIAALSLTLAYTFLPLGTAPVVVFSALAALLSLVFFTPALRAGRLWRNPMVIASLGMFFVYVLGLVHSNHSATEVVKALNPYRRFLFVPLLLALLWWGSTRRWAVRGFAISAAFVLIATYAHAVYPFSWAQATILQDVNDHYIFRDHNSQNLMLAALMVMMIWSYARGSEHALWNRIPSRSARRTVFAGALLAMIVACLFLSHGRAGHLAMLVIMVYAVWHFCPPRWRRQLAAAALVLAMLTSAGLMVSNHGRYALVAQDIKRFQQGDLLNNSIGLRLEFWRNGLLAFKERPVVGWGTGMYRKKYCSYGATKVSCEQGSYNPHNQFVLLAVELGVLGVMAYLGFLAYLWWRASTLSPRGLYLSRSLLLMLLVHSFSDSSLFVASPAHIFLLLLTVAFSFTREEHDPV